MSNHPFVPHDPGGILQVLLQQLVLGAVKPPDAPEPSARRIRSPEGLELAQFQARKAGVSGLQDQGGFTTGLAGGAFVGALFGGGGGGGLSLGGSLAGQKLFF